MAAQPAPVAVQPMPIPANDRRIGGDRRQGDQGDRRQGDRRGMDALRDEALRNVMSAVEDRNFGGIKGRVSLRPNPSKNTRRIALLGIAILAGAAAAFLAVQRPAEPVVEAAPVVEIVAEPRLQVLIATEAVAPGQRLATASLGWAEWPADRVLADFITDEASPNAVTEMANTVVRSEILPGEPIRQQKLAPDGYGNQIAAALQPGMRGVSVRVMAEAAVGGFLLPGDRVDVVLATGSDQPLGAETILTNVAVLAINANYGQADATKADAEAAAKEPRSFAVEAIATLALTPGQAEVIAGAVPRGQISLVLRGIDEAARVEAASKSTATNAAIRMSSPFWR